MTLDESDNSQVVALRFDEATTAEDLARWCDGQVEELTNRDDPTDVRTVIWVPGPEGPRAARPGDWIVRRSDGGYHPCSPDDFAAKYQPLD